jgi:hypothetical protein
MCSGATGRLSSLVLAPLPCYGGAKTSKIIAFY